MTRVAWPWSPTCTAAAAATIVDKAITALLNLEHRGAQGAEPHTGDGAGILLQVPDEFLRAVVEFDLPEYGSYATGIAFLPQSSRTRPRPARPWRRSPRPRASRCSAGARSRPTSRRWAPWPATRCRRSGRCSSQAPPAWISSAARTWCASVPSTSSAPRDPARTAPGRETVYFPSLSGQTFVYKGMLTTPQLKAFYS